MMQFRQVVFLALLVGFAVRSAEAGIATESKVVAAGGRSYRVQVVRIPLKEYRVKVGLAQGRVVATQALAGIAQRYGAVAAINGSFFGGYTKDAVKPPYHNLITDGELAHIGDAGTTLGFDREGNALMERVTVRVQGALDDHWAYPDNWYAYRVNHPLESASGAILYNRHWVGDKTPAGGTQISVEDGVVRAVGAGAQPLARDGFALLFAGGDRQLGSRFRSDRRCHYRIDYQAAHPEFWKAAKEALGCGPRLVADGVVAVDALGEKFTDPKILSGAGARSAVGITQSGTLLLVTCGGATVRQLAGVMKALGARDAMNLDGGASSSLWVQGRYLVRPGRDISNALLVLPR